MAAAPRQPLPSLAESRSAPRASRPGRSHRRALGRPGAHRRLAQTRPRLRRPARGPAAGWLPPAPLAKALVEYGKLLRTLHALRWFTDEAFRRRIGRQLNRGEALNDLRRFIFFAHRTVRYPHHDDQTTQAHCHTLVVNACILSTTGYLQDAIDADRAEGHQVSDEAIAHLSPAHFEAINPYGTLAFDVAAVLNRARRPLRRV